MKASEKAAEKSSKLVAEAASKLGSLSVSTAAEGGAEAKVATPRVADAKEPSPRAGGASAKVRSTAPIISHLLYQLYNRFHSYRYQAAKEIVWSKESDYA